MTGNFSGMWVLVSSALICAVLGSIHAFSVFLEPLETAHDLPRAVVSLTYSFALVILTLLVLLGPRLYSAVSPRALFTATGILGAFGTLLAGLSPGIIGVWFGYSLCFGAANGIGYGFALQYAARANPDRPGAAMGVVTAAYALGAVISPAIFVKMLQIGGFMAAMTFLAALLLLAANCAAWIVGRAGVNFGDSAENDVAALPTSANIAKTWIAYGCGVAAGLMVIGHAAGIATLAGITAWFAPALLAVCNLLGSYLGGYLADRVSHHRLMSALPLISIAGLLLLNFFPLLTLMGLGAVGFAYGGIIAAYPAIIAQRFPDNVGPRVYGRVFTAWGAAGLVAPWTAGLLFDQTQNYALALWIAILLALVSALMGRRVAR